MKAAEKTNVMRLLEQKKVNYQHYTYESEGGITGLEVAEKLGQDPAQVFKTLVTTGRSGTHYVFVIPVGAGLELKKAAKAVGEKSLEMLKQKDLLPLTGYIQCDGAYQEPYDTRYRFVGRCREPPLERGCTRREHRSYPQRLLVLRPQQISQSAYVAYDFRDA